MTRDEATRNYTWRIAGIILRALAWRNASIASVEIALGWEEPKLGAFLTEAINEGETDHFTLKDLAAVMHHLDFKIEFSIIPDKGTSPEAIDE